MNFRRNAGGGQPGFQIAPMLDVVFLLLFFFMVSAVYSQWEREIDIVLPSAESAGELGRLPGEIIINVLRDGAISVNQVRLTPPELEQRLARLSEIFPGQPVIVRADREAMYRYVMSVVDACVAADIWNISFATAIEEDD